MIRPINTLVRGWPRVRVITGRKRRFLGYRVTCCYTTPFMQKIATPVLGVYLVAVFLWLGSTAKDTGLEGGAFWLAFVALYLAGAVLFYALMCGRLQLEIRPQVIRWKRWGKWRNFTTQACEFAILPHDKAADEQLQEQQKLMDAQYSRSRSAPKLPGHFYRRSARIVLIVHRQHVDLAYVYGERTAHDLYYRLEALLVDIRARGWGQAG